MWQKSRCQSKEHEVQRDRSWGDMKGIKLTPSQLARKKVTDKALHSLIASSKQTQRSQSCSKITLSMHSSEQFVHMFCSQPLRIKPLRIKPLNSSRRIHQFLPSFPQPQLYRVRVNVTEPGEKILSSKIIAVCFQLYVEVSSTWRCKTVNMPN